MLRVLRRSGIAVGSVVMAWLAVSITGVAGSVGAAVALALGAVIYEDIVRRERPSA